MSPRQNRLSVATAITALVLAFNAPVSVHAQCTTASVRESSNLLDIAQGAMSRIAYLVGEWEGEGWLMMAPGSRTTYRQTERVVASAQNTALVIHGEGTERDNAGAVRIRYIVTHTANDGWDEIGEMSSDGGATWRQSMGMTLRRR